MMDKKLRQRHSLHCVGRVGSITRIRCITIPSLYVRWGWMGPFAFRSCICALQALHPKLEYTVGTVGCGSSFWKNEAAYWGEEEARALAPIPYSRIPVLQPLDVFFSGYHFTIGSFIKLKRKL
jgi:hypothetical protein